MSLKQLLDLSGRTALVTGGSRGLGLQVAEALGELGARVAISARKTKELDEAAAHLKALDIEAMPVVCDLSQADVLARMLERVIDGFGPIDILVNNAGTTWGAPAVEHPLDAWHKVMTLNLTAMFLVTQEVGGRCMLPRRRGKIINIASIYGFTGGDPVSAPTLAYNTSKGGVINFTRSLAAEWGAYDINVNAIAPGIFPTKMTKSMLAATGSRLAERTPLKRLGGAEDLKGAAALLASDAGAYISGQIIVVDGGATATL